MSGPDVSDERRVVAQATYTVTPAMVDAYADVSGDRNTIHLSDEAARERGFTGAIAHGHILLAFVSDLMTSVDPRWFAEGGLDARFRRPVSRDEEVVVHILSADHDASREQRLTFECRNAAGELAAVGSARIGGSPDGD